MAAKSQSKVFDYWNEYENLVTKWRALCFGLNMLTERLHVVSGENGCINCPYQTFWCWNRYNLEKIRQYRGCCCNNSLCHQAISSHNVYWNMGKFLSSQSFTICAMVVMRNGVKCHYILCFLEYMQHDICQHLEIQQNVITVTSQWTLWRLKSPAWRVFTQPCI